jgi:hypothetical protein
VIASFRSLAPSLLLLSMSGCSASPPPDGKPLATGLFETQTEKVPAAGDWYAADLNLDGKDELLLTQPSGRTRVYSFDAARGLEQTATLPAAKWISIGDVTDDGRPDVLLGGASFKGYRAVDELTYSPLSAKSVPLVGEDSGRLSVTSFPIVGRFHRADQLEPILVKDVYDLSALTPKPTEVESFSAASGEVASIGNAELSVPLSLVKRFVAMDLDGDGLDELWGMDFGGNLSQLRPAPSADGLAWRVEQRWAVGDPTRLALDDANGDGSPDLVGIGSALVVTGGRDGSAGRVHDFELPSSARGCVWIQLDDDAQRELACAGDGGDTPSAPAVYDADFEHDTLTRRDMPELSLEGQLLVGDFDGNGIDDLAAVDHELVISLGVAAP